MTVMTPDYKGRYYNQQLTTRDAVTIVFGEMYDEPNGNTYFDALVIVNGSAFEVRADYGHYAGRPQAIAEVLEVAGYNPPKGAINDSATRVDWETLVTVTVKKLFCDRYRASKAKGLNNEY